MPENIQFDQRCLVDKTVATQQAITDRVVEGNQLAHVDLSGRGVDLHVEVNAALHRDHTRLVRDRLSSNHRQLANEFIAGVDITQRKLGVDTKRRPATDSIVQEHGPVTTSILIATALLLHIAPLEAKNLQRRGSLDRQGELKSIEARFLDVERQLIICFNRALADLEKRLRASRHKGVRTGHIKREGIIGGIEIVSHSRVELGQTEITLLTIAKRRQPCHLSWPDFQVVLHVNSDRANLPIGPQHAKARELNGLAFPVAEPAGGDMAGYKVDLAT